MHIRPEEPCWLQIIFSYTFVHKFRGKFLHAVLIPDLFPQQSLNLLEAHHAVTTITFPMIIKTSKQFWMFSSFIVELEQEVFLRDFMSLVELIGSWNRNSKLIFKLYCRFWCVQVSGIIPQPIGVRPVQGSVKITPSKCIWKEQVSVRIVVVSAQRFEICRQPKNF